MRSVGIVVGGIFLTLLAGFGICAAAGWSVHPRALAMAGMISLIACMLAFVPLKLAHGGTQAATSQAALLGTLIHLMFSICMAAIVFLAGWADGSFTYWLLGFYWVTLVCLVVAMLPSLQATPHSVAKQP